MYSSAIIHAGADYVSLIHACAEGLECIQGVLRYATAFEC